MEIPGGTFQELGSPAVPLVLRFKGYVTTPADRAGQISSHPDKTTTSCRPNPAPVSTCVRPALEQPRPRPWPRTPRDKAHPALRRRSSGRLPCAEGCLSLCVCLSLSVVTGTEAGPQRPGLEAAQPLTCQATTGKSGNFLPCLLTGKMGTVVFILKGCCKD